MASLQSSILTLGLFLICINDILTSLQKQHTFAYADDITLVGSDVNRVEAML